MIANGSESGRGDRGEDLYEDRRRRHDRPPGPRPRVQGRHPHRGVWHGRRAERHAGRRSRARPRRGDADQLVAQLQNELFLLGSALADPLPDGRFHNTITTAHVEHLEQTIDSLEAELQPLLQFILPGGACRRPQFLHLARTVCRRAERLVVELSHQPDEAVAHSVLVYLNRLSDLLFVLARAVNHRAGVPDVIWKGI